MVIAGPDFTTDRWAGPQIMMSQPSGRSIFACPDRSVRSLPLANRAVVRPFSVS